MDAANDHCVMSIDVEDWFHILDLPSTPSLDEWDQTPIACRTQLHALAGFGG